MTFRYPSVAIVALFFKSVIGLLFIALFSITSYAGAADTSDTKNAYIADSPEQVRPVFVGQALPDAILVGLDGKKVSLSELVDSSPSLIIVYRGGWCPYCNNHFQDLRKILPTYSKKGLKIIALSPDSPESLKETDQDYGSVYQLYSDSDMQAAKALGLAYKVSASTNAMLKSYDIDLKQASGKDHGLLPVPAVFVVNREGDISFSFVSPEYKVRASNAVVAAAIEEVL
ncbi:peroxiredoxin-like family protein [Agaribacterium haliotis]|uniref:peroxiredoxin-like family protein n=1 Tax=Agaribacterium haliotis TaxID=2013869 RepID=UPI000BB5330C|nr:peroxiredoxin-like family protein [Agaribacterium haliotis]